MAGPNALSIGTIVALAGNLTDAVRSGFAESGWLVCDGTSYSAADYPQLYEAIGTAHGGSDGNFNVPDARGRFLRGTDSGAGNDPDASARTTANPGGNAGDAVGSLQPSGTALPKTSWTMTDSGDHVHDFSGLSNQTHNVNPGATQQFCEAPGSSMNVSSAGDHLHEVTGGDAQTVPKEIPLNWLIKAVPFAPAGTTAAGMIVGYGVPNGNPPVGWQLCNGMAQAAANSSLFTAIQMNFGGDQTAFNLPDFRGRFLRGTNHNTERDPDAATRTASATGGNAGDNVGSFQEWATGMPQTPLVAAAAGDHSHTCPNIPSNDHHVAEGSAIHSCMEWNAGPTSTAPAGSHVHEVLGGDSETRPENIYVNWLIASATINDAPPIGAMVAVGFDVTNPTNRQALQSIGWYPCVGDTLSAGSNTALYNAIGTTFGGNNVNFRLPDIRGLFILGVDENNELGDVALISLTGAPGTAFTTTSAGNHDHALSPVPTDTHGGDITVGWDMAEWNSGEGGSSTTGSHTHTISSGGDAESRPVNVYVDYVIRYA